MARCDIGCILQEKEKKVSREQAYRIPKKIVEYLCGTVQQPETTQNAIHTNTTVQEVTVLPWQHKPWRPFRLGRMYHKGGCFQLMLEVDIDIAGVHRKATALVDTGAQTSPVRRDLLPRHCFTPSNRPLILKTVSGEELAGGRNEAKLELSFIARSETGNPVDGIWSTTVEAHDGDIGCDLILGYP